MAVEVTGGDILTVVYDDTLLQDRNWQLTQTALTLGKHYRACEQDLKALSHRHLDSGRTLETGVWPCNRE